MKKSAASFTVSVLVILLASSMASTSRPADAAQEATAVATQATPTTVSIKLPNGEAIDAVYYAPPTGSGKAPAAVLLHELGASPDVWKHFVPKLAELGYAALLPVKFPTTKGGEDSILAIAKWLRQQPGIDGSRVAMLGASIGANLSIRECAIDADCKVVVALSPGLDYRGVTTQDAIANMAKRSVLIMAGQGDPSSKGIAQVSVAAPITANVLLRMYALGFSHGTQMLSDSSFAPDAEELVIHWLKLYN
jgi:dienelactone hydrolase